MQVHKFVKVQHMHAPPPDASIAGAALPTAHPESNVSSVFTRTSMTENPRTINARYNSNAYEYISVGLTI